MSASPAKVDIKPAVSAKVAKSENQIICNLHYLQQQDFDVDNNDNWWHSVDHLVCWFIKLSCTDYEEIYYLYQEAILNLLWLPETLHLLLYWSVSSLSTPALCRSLQISQQIQSPAKWLWWYSVEKSESAKDWQWEKVDFLRFHTILCIDCGQYQLNLFKANRVHSKSQLEKNDQKLIKEHSAHPTWILPTRLLVLLVVAFLKRNLSLFFFDIKFYETIVWNVAKILSCTRKSKIFYESSLLIARSHTINSNDRMQCWLKNL